MAPRRRAMGAGPGVCAALALALWAASAAACGGEASDADGASADPGRLVIWFLLDPRLTQGLYMGERWVSPPTHSVVQDGATMTVDAKAERVEGQPSDRAFEWTPSDDEQLTVTPSQGERITITVLRPGRTTLTVVQGGAEKLLTFDAARDGDRWSVTITQ